MTAPSSPGPATPQRTWSYGAFSAAKDAAVVEVGEERAHDVAVAWLAALAPHVAQQVADLTAEVERLRTIAEAARDTRFPDGEVYVSYEMYDHALTLCVEAETERDALKRQLDTTNPTNPTNERH